MEGIGGRGGGRDWREGWWKGLEGGVMEGIGGRGDGRDWREG